MVKPHFAKVREFRKGTRDEERKVHVAANNCDKIANERKWSATVARRVDDDGGSDDGGGDGGGEFRGFLLSIKSLSRFDGYFTAGIAAGLGYF